MDPKLPQPGKAPATNDSGKWVEMGHIIVKAGEAVDWDFQDVGAFAKRVQLIDYGLSAEVEFSALLSWLGRCSLVQRLEQDFFSSENAPPLRVPDLLALVEYQNVRLPLLIEVKTTKKERLSFRTSDLESMRTYAAALSMPLLVAWKPRRLGFWFLLDPVHGQQKGGKTIITLPEAAKNDLMSTVAGDFLVVPMPSAGIYFEAEIRKKVATKSGMEGIAQITKAELRDAKGNSAKNVPRAIQSIIFATMEVNDYMEGDRLVKSFVTTEKPTHAQQILRTSVTLRAKGKKPIRWRHVARDFASYLTRDELHEAVQGNFGTFIRFQFFQHPNVWPTYLPETWNALSLSPPE